MNKGIKKLTDLIKNYDIVKHNNFYGYEESKESPKEIAMKAYIRNGIPEHFIKSSISILDHDNGHEVKKECETLYDFIQYYYDTKRDKRFIADVVITIFKSWENHNCLT